MDPPRVRQLRADLRALIRNLGVLQARFPELGLGVSQCHTLLELERGERSVGELRDLLRIDASSASRNLATLERHELVKRRSDPTDPRRKLFRLSRPGRDKTRAIHERGDRVMQRAFDYLTPSEQGAVALALGALARAVDLSNQEGFEVRLSRPEDNPAIASVVRSVLTELGMAHSGTAYAEATTDELHDVYRRVGGEYWVVSVAGRVEGGGGVWPHTPEVCELKNLYFTPAVRGRGLAKCLLNRLLEFARRRAFREIFLETHSGWAAAAKLYAQFGFRPCAQPDFYRGHPVCDRYYSLSLDAAPRS